MRQAIEEKFILDVLEHYMTYKTFFRLIKAIEDDPRVEKRKADEGHRYPVVVEREADGRCCLGGIPTCQKIASSTATKRRKTWREAATSPIWKKRRRLS